MTSVWDYSATAASNNAASPAGMPEGMPPSGVNDAWRLGVAMMFEGLAKSTVAGGTADALTVTFTNAPTAPSTLIDGMQILVRAAAANATTTPTLAVNGGTARTITKQGGSALAAGDIVAAGHELLLRYNLASTRWDLLNPKAPVSTFIGGTLTATTAMSGAAFNDAFATIASATTTNIGAAAANYLQVTGTTTITAFDTVQAGTERVLEFAGILTLTHNSTTLILPAATSITTAAGDCAIFRSEGSGNWRCISYELASGRSILGTVLPTVIVQDRKATTTAGGSFTQNTYTDHDLNTLILNTVGGVTAVATPNLTLPAGTYDVTAMATITFATGGAAKMRLFNTTDAAVQVDTNANDIVNLNSGTNAGVAINNTPLYPLRARFTIAAQKNMKFQVWNNQTGATAGSAQNGTGNAEPEVYLSAEFVKVA